MALVSVVPPPTWASAALGDLPLLRSWALTFSSLVAVPCSPAPWRAAARASARGAHQAGPSGLLTPPAPAHSCPPRLVERLQSCWVNTSGGSLHCGLASLSSSPQDAPAGIPQQSEVTEANSKSWVPVIHASSAQARTPVGLGIGRFPWDRSPQVWASREVEGVQMQLQ